MANVADDADDLVGLVPASGPNDQSLAECFFVRENVVHERLAPDDHPGALTHFLVSEVAAALQRDSHRAEVVLIHATKVGKSIIGRNGRSALDCERHLVRLTAEGKVGNETDS